MRGALVSLFLVCGCAGDLGGAPPSGPVGPQPDAAPVEPPPPQGPPCQNKVVDAAQIPDGHHFPGQDCMGACHDHGFTLGGTLLTKTKAVNPGGVITITDAMQKTISVTAGTNGNFYTSELLVFPLKVYASACPDVAEMVSEVKEGEGGCAKGGCHTGGTTGISEVTL